MRLKLRKQSTHHAAGVASNIPLAGALYLFLYLVASTATATMIMRVSFEEVVAGSELIFQGEVVSQTVRDQQGSGRPTTFVTFNIEEIIKGDYSEPTIELRFAGGALNNRTAHTTAGLVAPAMGERGIYFVVELGKRYINPLYGWHQGHYIITRDTDGNQVIHQVKSDVDEYVPGSGQVRRAPLPTAESLTSFKQRLRQTLTAPK